MDALDAADHLVTYLFLPLMLPLGAMLLFGGLLDVATRPADAPRVPRRTLAMGAFLTVFPIALWLSVSAQREADDVITAIHPLGTPRAVIPTGDQRFVVDMPSGFYTLSGDLQGFAHSVALQIEDRASGRSAVCTAPDANSSRPRQCWWRVQVGSSRGFAPDGKDAGSRCP